MGRTWEGRSIVAFRIAPKAAADARRILILGGHHAREWIAAEIPCLIAERLVAQASLAPISALLSRLEVWVIPVLNPDGSDFSHLPDSAGGDRMWRKNRRPVGRDTLGRPVYGVDLNRNYATGFQGGGSASGVPAAENYPGEEAFSELETQAVRALTRQYNFTMAISFHSYSQEVLYPFGFSNPPCDAACQASLVTARSLAADLVTSMGTWHGTSYVSRATLNRYPTSGDCADWLLSERKIPAVTIELPPRSYDDSDQRFMLDTSEISPIFEGVWLGIVAAATRAAAL